MVFSSYAFILVFLPIVAGLTWLTHRIAGARAVIALLTLASFAFYAYWDWRFLPLLLGSIVFNHFCARLIIHSNQYRKIITIIGISVNILNIGFFKYFNFFVSNVNALTNSNIDMYSIILPIGISFFTFQQIAYLVDVYNERKPEYSLLDYSFFVSFFPQLIAGPVVHHKDIMPQLQQSELGRFRLHLVNRGIAIFIFGLSKKVLIADTIAGYSDRLFAAAAAGGPFSTFEAWGAATTYGLQLYFDFSGYADMAIGLGLIFGVRLPENFNRPYAALSIRDFWRRWHITLSQFLRDYLYIPLGGNRRGPSRAMVNLMITMVLGGIWHGAGWTFIIWGALHGTYLVVQRLFEIGRKSLGLPALPWPVAWTLTIVAVFFAWVPFRAESLAATLVIWQGMLFTGPLLPEAFGLAMPGSANALLAALNLEVGGPLHLSLREWLPLLPMLLAFLGLSIILPNGHAVATHIFGPDQDGRATFRPDWRLRARGGLSGALASFLLIASMLYLSYETVFLYFQF